jgi:hypothetical protein
MSCDIYRSLLAKIAESDSNKESTLSVYAKAHASTSMTNTPAAAPESGIADALVCSSEGVGAPLADSKAAVVPNFTVTSANASASQVLDSAEVGEGAIENDANMGN